MLAVHIYRECVYTLLNLYSAIPRNVIIACYLCDKTLKRTKVICIGIQITLKRNTDHCSADGREGDSRLIGPEIDSHWIRCETQ